MVILRRRGHCGAEEAEPESECKPADKAETENWTVVDSVDNVRNIGTSSLASTPKTAIYLALTVSTILIVS